MSAAGIAGWGLEALAASAALMLLVLLLRRPVRRAFGPDVAYALWALPVLRLLLPPLPSSWREAAAAPIAAARETITLYVAEPIATTTSATVPAALPIAAIVTALWIVGALAFLAWHMLAHLRFCRRLLDQQVRGSEIDHGIHLIETEAASGPLAFGVLRRYVAFPRDFVERYDQDERDLALAHELGHHARGDLIANWIALAVLALHWFNPVAWRAFRAFRADQEIANDARVLAGMSATARHTYACAIVKSAHGGAVSAACHLHTINDLKGRLKMLTTNKTSRTRLLSGATAVAALTIAGLGLTASGTQAAASVRDRVETATGMTLASLSAPTAAELPVAPQVNELPQPPAPPTPPAPIAGTATTSTTTTTVDGKTVAREVKIVRRGKDGTIQTQTFPSVEEMRIAMPDIPDITSQSCPGAGDKNIVLQDVKDGKRRMIVCTNRIQRISTDAAQTAVDAGEIQRGALQTALASLRSTRASMAANTGLSAEARTEAVKGIDDAIREVQQEMNDVK